MKKENHLELTNEVKTFSERIKKKREEVKNLVLYERYEDKNFFNELCFLRRWNSHSPLVYETMGGGFFVHWNNKGTIIDPGCSFLRVFSQYCEYSLHKINMIIVSHDHVDHSGDLIGLITLLREFNKLRIEKKAKPLIWDVVISHGVYDQYKSILSHPDNSMFVNTRIILPPANLDRVLQFPDYFEEALAICDLEPHLKSNIQYRIEHKLKSIYGYDLRFNPTLHNELLGEHTGFSITLNLMKEDRIDCVISFSSDTAVNLEKLGARLEDFTGYWKDTNLLVLNVGTMEDPIEGNAKDFTLLKEHLGFSRIYDILWKLKDSNKLKMVVLSEWGYEFGRNETKGRTKLCELLQDAFEKKDCYKYYSITKSDRNISNIDKIPFDKKIPIIPCDLNLRVSLPDLKIWGEYEEKEKDKTVEKSNYFPHHEIIAREDGDSIVYEKM